MFSVITRLTADGYRTGIFGMNEFSMRTFAATCYFTESGAFQILNQISNFLRHRELLMSSLYAWPPQEKRAGLGAYIPITSLRPRAPLGEWRAEEGARAVDRQEAPRRNVTFVPARDRSTLGIDEQGDAPNFAGGEETASPGQEQQLPAQSMALPGAGDRQSPETKHRHVMAGESPSDHLRRARVGHRSGAQAVEAEHAAHFGIGDRQKGFGAAPFVALAGMVAQKVVQGGFAAIKPFPV